MVAVGAPDNFARLASKRYLQTSLDVGLLHFLAWFEELQITSFQAQEVYLCLDSLEG